MPVIYPSLDLGGALKQKAGRGPRTPGGIFDSSKSEACILKHIKAVMEESDNDE